MWQDTLALTGTISTGSIDTVFTKASLTTGNKEVGTIEFTDDRKGMMIMLELDNNSAYKPIETFIANAEKPTLGSKGTQDHTIFLRLSENAGEEYQGKNLTITFTYDWTQVNNTDN